MQVRMLHQILSPGVQHGHHPGERMQILLILCQGEQTFRGGFKEDIVHTFLIDQTQPVELGGSVNTI